VQDRDVVITMGCGDACPSFPGKRYQNWELADLLPTDDPHPVEVREVGLGSAA